MVLFIIESRPNFDHTIVESLSLEFVSLSISKSTADTGVDFLDRDCEPIIEPLMDVISATSCHSKR
ncbi:hypothetical protein DERF_014114 [Dermatophagoides farinae]|uniref:Uncharacterized protein n=1 Tax=Dermatophagoides farinae TaxID=6954 RepID=A0A922L101_DERFA|nr:hypothetical protein DERF_014114 [Dermatophagoides farinae]